MVVATSACSNSSCTDVPASPQVGQKGFNILSRPLFQRFAFKKIVELLRPPDIEGRTVWPYPVLLRARPVEPHGQALGTSDNAPLWGDIPAKSSCIHPRLRSWPCAAGVGIPKTIDLFGVLGTHGIHPEIHFKGGT
jgi:hypothetical protein